MKLNNLFTNHIVQIWGEAQRKEMSWDDVNAILSYLHYLLTVIMADKKAILYIDLLAGVAWERHQMDCRERRQYHFRALQTRIFLEADETETKRLLDRA